MASGAENVFLEVAEARGLKSVKTFGSQHPMCTVSLGPQSFATDAGSGQEVSWKRRFVFTQSAREVEANPLVALQVDHKGTLGVTGIGSATANLRDLLAAGETWVTLKDGKGKAAGEVRIVASRGAAGGSGAPSAPAAGAGAGVGAGAGAGAGVPAHAPPAYGTGAAAGGAGAGAVAPPPVPATAAAASAAAASGTAAGAGSSDPKLPEPVLPAVLDGKFTDLHLLGAGNFGRAYRVKSLVDDEVYALKMIAIRSEGELETVKQEAKVLLPLAHASIVRYFSSFMHTDAATGVQYFCMVVEYCDAGCVNDVIEGARAAGTRINDGLIGLWLWQIASALAYLHANGVMHRDLKGDNIFLRGQDVKLADFGLASVSASAVGQSGAYAYEAPEQASGGVYSFGNDMWAVGCLITELVTSRFMAERAEGAVSLNAAAINAAIAETAAAHPYLGALAQRLLAFDPAARMTAQQLVDELTPQLPHLRARAAAPTAASPAAPAPAMHAPAMHAPAHGAHGAPPAAVYGAPHAAAAAPAHAPVAAPPASGGYVAAGGPPVGVGGYAPPPLAGGYGAPAGAYGAPPPVYAGYAPAPGAPGAPGAYAPGGAAPTGVPAAAPWHGPGPAPPRG